MTDPTPVAVAPPPADAASPAEQHPPQEFSPARWWVLTLLILVYISNFADRQILGSLQPLIQRDLQLDNAQFGILHGVAFALFYVTMGVPIAWLAERKNRVLIITASTAIWSVMTAFSGLAGNFWQLLLARFGVAIGEAGCGPASNSVLADYFPPHRRATVIGLFSLGIPIGSLVGAMGGAIIGQMYGWRTAFFVVGLPGVLLAVLVWLTIKEPKRGGLDKAGAGDAPAPSFGSVFKFLFTKPALIHMGIGGSLSSMAGYGIAAFAVSLLVEGYRMNLVAAATAFALIGCAASAAGTALGGVITDKFGKRDDRWRVWIPGAGLLIAGPLYAIGFQQPSVILLSLFVIVPIMLQYLYMGPVFGLLHNMVQPRMRATAVAIVNFFVNLIGLGAGPTLVGVLARTLSERFYDGPGDYIATCPAGLPPAGASAAVETACRTAFGSGLQWSMSITSVVWIWAGIHFFLAARSLRRDLET